MGFDFKQLFLYEGNRVKYILLEFYEILLDILGKESSFLIRVYQKISVHQEPKRCRDHDIEYCNGEVIKKVTVLHSGWRSFQYCRNGHLSLLNLPPS